MPRVFEGYRRRPSPIAPLERLIFRGSLGGTLESVRLVHEDGQWRLNGAPFDARSIASGYVAATSYPRPTTASRT